MPQHVKLRVQEKKEMSGGLGDRWGCLLAF